jgi:hypothetical protein
VNDAVRRSRSRQTGLPRHFGAQARHRPGTSVDARMAAGARIRTWELLREQILSLPPLAARPPRLSRKGEVLVYSSSPSPAPPSKSDSRPWSIKTACSRGTTRSEEESVRAGVGRARLSVTRRTRPH